MTTMKQKLLTKFKSCLDVTTVEQVKITPIKRNKSKCKWSYIHKSIVVLPLKRVVFTRDLIRGDEFPEFYHEIFWQINNYQEHPLHTNGFKSVIGEYDEKLLNRTFRRWLTQQEMCVIFRLLNIPTDILQITMKYL